MDTRISERTSWFFSMNLFNRFENQTEWFIHELEWFDCSCSQHNNSLIQWSGLQVYWIVHVWLTQNEPRAGIWVWTRLLARKVSNLWLISVLSIVNENHIGHVSYLWSKSVEKRRAVLADMKCLNVDVHFCVSSYFKTINSFKIM